MEEGLGRQPLWRNRIARNLMVLTGLEFGSLAVEFLQNQTLKLSDSYLRTFSEQNPLTFDIWANTNAYGTSVLQGVSVAYLIDLAENVTKRTVNNTLKVLLSTSSHVVAEFIALNFRDELRAVDPIDIAVATATSLATFLVRGLIDRRNATQMHT